MKKNKVNLNAAFVLDIFVHGEICSMIPYYKRQKQMIYFGMFVAI